MLSPLLIQCDNTFKQSLLFPFTVTLTNIADAAAAPAVDACFVYFWHNNSLFIGIVSRCDFSKEYIRQRKLTFVSSLDCITRTTEVIQRTKKKINTIDDVNGVEKKNSCVNNITYETHQKSENCVVFVLSVREGEEGEGKLYWKGMSMIFFLHFKRAWEVLMQ